MFKLMTMLMLPSHSVTVYCYHLISCVLNLIHFLVKLNYFYLTWIITPQLSNILHTCYSYFYKSQLTDIKTAAAFTKDIKELGFGSMRINNYRKNGEVFNASITVFPVYDSIETGDVPVLTHFAALLNDVRWEGIEATHVLDSLSSIITEEK